MLISTHTKGWRRIRHVCPQTEPSVTRVVCLINITWSCCLTGGRGNQRVEGTEDGEGRASRDYHTDDAKVNNTRHALRGKCGYAGREVMQWKLRYGERGDLGECRAGREMAESSRAGRQRELVLTACWRRIMHRTCMIYVYMFILENKFKSVSQTT